MRTSLRAPVPRLARVCLLLLALLSGPGAVTAAQPADPVTANLASWQTVATLDPAQLAPFESDFDARDLVENLFVGLTALNPRANNVEMSLAQSWQVSDDGLTWVFTLRDDVYWVRHNPITGETYRLRPVTADDFVFGMQHVCSPLTGSPYFTSIFIVDGCQVVYRTKPEFVTDDLVTGRVRVRAVDQWTVEYRLVFPAAYFLTFTAMPEFRPLPREFVHNVANWDTVSSVITNGPFVVTDWAQGQSITLARNPHWPGDWAGNVERVRVTFMAGALEATVSQFDAGAFDRAPVPPDAAARGVPPALIHSLMRPSVMLIGFSAERGLVSERGVRQALAWAIDRSALVNQVLPGEGIAMTHFSPPGMVAGPDLDRIGKGFDPDAARQAFAVAGHERCANIPEQIEVMVDDSPRSQATAQFIVESWQRELGCNPGLFVVTPVPFRTVLANARDTYSDEPDYLRPHVWLVVNWTADYYDANNWLSDALHCQYGTFRLGFPCDETDALIDAAGVLYDLAERARVVAEIEDRLFGEVGKYPIVPLYMAVQPVAQQPWLTTDRLPAGLVGPARYDRWVIDTAARGA